MRPVGNEAGSLVMKGLYQTGQYGIVLIMLTQMATSPPKRGRPRDPAVDRAILESARTTLAQRGFTGTSMDEIARGAGIGKDTLYRRYRSKEDLVLHLLTELAEENVPVPALDDARYALFVFLQNIVRVNKRTDLGAIIAGIVGESSRNQRLAEGFRQFWSERRSIAAKLVREIVPGAATDDEVELMVDHIVGPIYYRLLLTGARVDDEYLWGLIVTIPWSPDEQLNQTEPG
jgi:AcrR family transcriptional regulator